MTDDQVTDDQVTDDQVTDDQVTDDQVTSDETISTRINRRKVREGLVVFVNFLILKIRYEFEYISELTNEIYLYDYLVAFLFSFYFVDSLNIINGLF